MKTKDSTLLKLYEKVAEQNNVSPDLVEHIIMFIFAETRYAISNSTGKNVLIHGLGNFYIPKNKTKRFMEFMMSKLEKGHITKQQYDEYTAKAKEILKNTL